MKTKLMIIMILTLAAASCGAKKESSAVKLKIFQGFTSAVSSGASSPFAGGVLFMGKSEDGKHSFRMGVTDVSQGIDLTLPKGRWEFAAVSWSGGAGGNLTGMNRCAYTGMRDLQASDMSITFDLSTYQCTVDFNGRKFVDSQFRKASGEFYKFTPVMCGALEQCVTRADPTINPTSLIRYKMVYKTDRKGEVLGGAFVDLESSCLPFSGAGTTVPVTDTAIDSPMDVTMLAFTTENCSGTPVVYDFQDGIKNNVNPIVSNADTYFAYLFINPGSPYVDGTVVNPTGSLSLSGGTDVYGVSYYTSTSVGYSISSIPADVAFMCLTISASSSGCSWVNPQSGNGSFSVAATVNGIQELKLYYKTFAGEVSTTPEVKQFVRPFSPVSDVVATISGSNISVSWNSNTTYDTSYHYTKIKFFDIDNNEISSLTRIVYDKELRSTGSISTGSLPSSQLVCPKVFVYNQAGHSSESATGGCVTVGVVSPSDP